MWNYLIDTGNVIGALGEDEADYISGDLLEYLGEYRAQLFQFIEIHEFTSIDSRRRATIQWWATRFNVGTVRNCCCRFAGTHSVVSFIQ